jgi:hypothetical protein
MLITEEDLRDQVRELAAQVRILQERDLGEVETIAVFDRELGMVHGEGLIHQGRELGEVETLCVFDRRKGTIRSLSDFTGD